MSSHAPPRGTISGDRNIFPKLMLRMLLRSAVLFLLTTEVVGLVPPRKPEQSQQPTPQRHTDTPGEVAPPPAAAPMGVDEPEAAELQ